MLISSVHKVIVPNTETDNCIIFMKWEFCCNYHFISSIEMKSSQLCVF